jgi:hypothetical protein
VLNWPCDDLRPLVELIRLDMAVRMTAVRMAEVKP